MISLPERRSLFTVCTGRTRADIAPDVPHDFQDIGRDDGTASRDRIGRFDLEGFDFGQDTRLPLPSSNWRSRCCLIDSSTPTPRCSTGRSSISAIGPVTLAFPLKLLCRTTSRFLRSCARAISTLILAR